MAYKYFYIDDDPIETITETARGLSIQKDYIEVIPFQHETWDNELTFLIKNVNDYDGIILDWKLSKENKSSDKANYSVEALAQQIRLLVSEKTINKDFPIILCSAEFNFKKNFKKESTTQDLFDIIYEKDEFDDRKKEVIDQLFALAEGYGILKKDKKLDSILGRVDNLDYRLKDHLEKLIKDEVSNYDIIGFCLKKVIEIPGLLIDEKTLASRLGVDIIESKKDKDWEYLLGELTSFKYDGVLSKGWNRWWSSNLITWWRNNFDSEIGNLKGEKRVEHLNQKFSINLNVASKTSKSKSTDFWLVCKKTGRPISFKDAILSSETYDKVPWQEDEYYSIDSALEESIDKIHPLDRDKVEKLKIRYTEERKKDV